MGQESHFAARQSRCIVPAMHPDIRNRIEGVAELAEVLRVTLLALMPAEADEGWNVTPLRIERLRQLLLFRVTDLAVVASDLYLQKRAIAGVLCTRAIMESVAVACQLDDVVEQFLAQGDRFTLETEVRKLEFGSRMKGLGDAPQAVNVLTLIDKVEKQVPDYRMTYDLLSEMCHPNWSGVFGSYSTEAEGVTWLGIPGFDSPAMRTGLGALESVLALGTATNAKLTRKHREVMEVFKDTQ